MGYRGTTLTFYKLTTNKFEMYPAEVYSPIVPLLKWTNITAVYNGAGGTTNNLVVYQNGLSSPDLTTITSPQYLRDADQPTLSASTMTFFVGGDPVGNEYLNGYISSVQVYNRALSKEEVVQNFNARRLLFGQAATSSTTTVEKISMNTNTVFASDFDEVSGMGFLPNMLTYFDAGKIESYNFNYDRQRLVDLSTSSRIVMQNTATWVSTFTGGLSYPVVSGTVSGTEPWVQLQDSVLNNRSSGTISAWIQYTAFSRSGDYHDNFGQALVSRQRDGVGTWAHLSVSGFVNSGGGPVLGTTGKIYWHPRNGIAPANSTANLAYNTVYHVAVSFDTSGCRFYINGVLDSTTTGDYSIPSSQEATFGTAVAVWRYGGEYYMPWSGYIYSMKFYNAALNPGQVAENYNADAARFNLTPIQTPSVYRQYSTGRLAVSGMFDEIVGAPIVDSSLALWLDSISYSGSGTSLPSSATSLPAGTLVNSPTYNTRFGGSFSFNGTSQYISATLNSALGSFNTTLECWVNITLNTRGPFLYMGGNTNGYGIGIGASDFTSTGNNLILSANFTFTGSRHTFTSGGWKHIVCSLGPNNNTWNLYVDGVNVNANFTQGQGAASSQVYISYDSTSYGSNPVAVARIYSRALSAAEILENYLALKSRYV
jgi:hypothetical protein